MSITSASPGATIRYTLDGSTPGETSAIYTAPLSIATSTTVKAVGMRANWTSTSVSTITYTMNFGTLAAPVLMPGSGTYTSEVVVTMTAFTGASIRYTTNGSTPTISSAAYTAPIAVGTTTTLKARAFHPDYTASPETSAVCTIVVATPELTPTSGTYPSGQTVTVSTATAGATITYTLNGLEPTATDATLPSGSTIVMGNFTLKAKAWKTGATPSSTVTASYQASGTVTPRGISAGDAHSLLVREDALGWAWGYNGTGQLGDGTTTRRTLPVIIGGMAGAVMMAAGDFHSLAVRTDGKVFAWGSNTNGRLGDGTTTQRTIPVAVSSLTDVVSVAGGGTHSLALRSNGTVWSWGNNSNGQIGDATTTQRLTPVQVTTLANMTGVSAGGTWSVAVRSDGTAWSWGNNGNGQLGDGTHTGRTAPVQVTGLTTVVAVSAGSAHAVALLANGTLRGWGFNGYGQVGDGTLTERTAPVVVQNLTDVTQTRAGGFHSLALKADGTVWAWGYNAQGQVGDGTLINRSTPVQVSGLTDIVDVAAGAYHSLALASDGSVWAWGRNTDGQLGDGTLISRSLPVQIAGPGVAWKVAAPVLSHLSGTYSSSQTVTVTCSDTDAVLHYTTNGQSPTQADAIIASGGTIAINHTLTLNVRAWKPGFVSSETTTAAYQLKAVTPVLTPASGAYAGAQTVSISTATPGATIRYTLDGSEPTTASSAYTAELTVSETGSVKARAYRTDWTPSDSGVHSYWISAGTVTTPTIAPAPGTFTVAPLVTLSSTTAGATIRYTIDGTDPTESSPRYQFPFLINTSATLTVRAYNSGYTPSAVASAAFSLDAPGQTGVPTIVPGGGVFTTHQTVQVTGPAGATLRFTMTGIDPTENDVVVPMDGLIEVHQSGIVKVRAWRAGATPSAVTRADFMITGAIAAGDQHSLGLAADGTVWAWGRNSEGQLGDGTAFDRASPVAVFTDAIASAGGTWHSVAVRRDGTVWAWGQNGTGRLGIGTTVGALSPLQSVGISDVMAVAGGADHTLALKRDGTVWAWGNNPHGQLGDGTTTMRLSPVQVIGLTGVTSIAAGDGFSVAVQRDGAAGGLVWSWGRNESGQLGDGSLLTRTIPVRAVGITTAVEAAAREGSALVRLADGSLRAWGLNDSSQLGSAVGPIAMVPTEVRPLTDMCALAVGRRQALSVGCDGRAWGWGDANAPLGALPQTPPVAIQTPRYVPESARVLSVATGWPMTLQLRTDGSVWGSGFLLAAGLGAGEHWEFEQIPALSLVTNAWLTSDTDGDGLSNWAEYAAGTDPLRIDTNGNGLSDLVDARRGVQGGNPDDDGDGVPNALEIAMGTDPFKADTDGDAVPDLLDDYPLDPTRNQKPAPNPADTTPPTIILTLPASARPIGGGGE